MTKYFSLNKADICEIVLIILISAFLWCFLFFNVSNKESSIAVVQYQNKEVLRIDLTVDATYEYEATLGTVYIEVKDGAIRVEKENSPHHYCSLQGWVDNANAVIVCLPNELVITLSGQGNDINLR